MDALGKNIRAVLRTAYSPPKPRLLNGRKPFHLGISFDLIVVAVLIIAIVGYLTT